MPSLFEVWGTISHFYHHIAKFSLPPVSGVWGATHCTFITILPNFALTFWSKGYNSPQFYCYLAKFS